MGERELEVHSVRRLRHVPDVVFERHARVPVWSVTYKQNCVARESVRNAVRSLVTRERVELTIELIAQLCEAAARGTARTESDARGIASRLEDGFTREAPPLIENQTVARARETVQTAGGRPDAGVAIGALPSRYPWNLALSPSRPSPSSGGRFGDRARGPRKSGRLHHARDYRCSTVRPPSDRTS